MEQRFEHPQTQENDEQRTKDREDVQGSDITDAALPILDREQEDETPETLTRDDEG